MTRRRLFTIGCLLAVALAAVVWIVASAGETARDRLAYETCREANLPNAYIRLVLERTPGGFDSGRLRIPAPDEALPILSCQQTVDRGKPVRLSLVEERRYLRVLARGRLPLVRDGRVVGSDPLPAPPRR